MTKYCVLPSMSDKDQNRWEQLKNYYIVDLDRGPVYSEIAFTPHDYSRHCRNIYRNISSLLGNNLSNGKISCEELFILNVATLLHDISMIFAPNKRTNHSVLSGEILNRFMKAEASVAGQVLSDWERRCIAHIMAAHSDPIVNGAKKHLFDEMPATENIPGNKSVRLRLLAGILRIADELDIGKNRIQGYNTWRWMDMPEASDKHWRRCELFRDPVFKSHDKTINLEPEVNEDISDSDIALILHTEHKANEEFTRLNTVCRFGEHLSDFNIDGVKLHINDAYLAEMVNNFRNHPGKQFHDIFDSKKKDKTGVVVDDKPRHPFTRRLNLCAGISESNGISNCRIDCNVKNNNLIINHCRKTHCDLRVRDWISIKNILFDREQLLGILNSLAPVVHKDFSDCFFIGIGFKGLLIASALAYRTGRPFSYMIAKKYENNHGYPEVSIEITSETKIVLITDTIITGTMVRECIDNLEARHGIKAENIKGILAVFGRSYKQQNGMPPFSLEKYFDKTFVLSNSFDIELCEKEESSCFFQDCKIKDKYIM